ncbi:histidinol-phosphate transaminase [Uliginosibacterium sp. H3]|uniref:Histidinol-phosphate aminotransferase n=1 Tax=Uliginosibacterium silvisoli TaxID=3114758 RepID=A0ABU6JZ53_9RHOO|nr:histidinol-phosphate transaminase [Uliginosibacterium sp. H3]
MSQFWSPLVSTLSPYVPGEQPKIAKLIKLNTNENPYGPSPRAITAMQAQLGDSLRLYPNAESSTVRQAVAAMHGVSEANVFVGNGSDEVLAHAFAALLKHPRPLYFPDISYSFYPVYCGLFDIAFKQVPLDEGFGIRLADYDEGAGAIIFPNPNAPTGRALPLAEIEALLQARSDVPVIVDEAYVDFGAESAIPLVVRYPNLLVVQTLSKSRSLAGLRVGFAVGDVALIEALTRVKDSFNSYPLDRIAQAGAVAALEDREWFEQTRQRIIASREALVVRMQALGFEVLPSAANFVFARHPQHDAAQLAAKLRERAILVRHFRSPRIDQFLRITIGDEAQCEALLQALAALT